MHAHWREGACSGADVRCLGEGKCSDMVVCIILCWSAIGSFVDADFAGCVLKSQAIISITVYM